jgi:hypothetical protein
MRADGQTTFCLLEFEVKFEKKNGAIFMFRADKVFRYKKPRESIWYGIFPKNLCTKSFGTFKGIMIISLIQFDILITILFGMFFFFRPKNHHHN